MKQNKILDIIINLLNGIKNDNQLLEKTDENRTMYLVGCSYLLNQTIRQYQIPKSHYFISEKAFELWNKLSTDDMLKYSYRDKVVKNTEDEVVIDKYKGSEKTPFKKSLPIKKGEGFIYNDVFTDEHIVTVSNIIDELLDLPTYDYLAITKILDKIYICKMLKSEDHIIKNRSNRSTDYREVIIRDYQEVGIKVKNFDYRMELKNLITKYQLALEELERSEEVSVQKYT